jgi:hypothetical protein
MAHRNHRRAAWAIGLSLVLHVLTLSGMVFGLKVLKLPVEDRAIELSLVPAFQPQPRAKPEPVRPPPARPAVAQPLRPRAAPQPPPESPVPAPPQAPAAPAPPARVYGPDPGPKGVGPSLSGRLGCDDPLTYHLTEAQTQVCANNLAKIGREAKSFDLNIPADKRAEYDRSVHCKRDYTERGGIAPLTEYNPDGSVKTGPAAGLGYIPSFKECPVKSR